MHKAYIISFFILLLVKSYSWGQVPTTPQFPAPENKIYDFLNDPRITDPKEMNGRVRHVVRNFIAYGEDGKVELKENETTVFGEKGEILEHKTSNNSYKPAQKLDTINGYHVIIIDLEDFGTEEFWYKNQLLMKRINHADGWEEIFEYDNQNRLIVRRKYAYDVSIDENLAAKKEIEAELVRYVDDKIYSKESYVFWLEVINVNKVIYAYNNQGFSSRYTYSYKRFLIDESELEKPLETLIYKKEDLVEGEEARYTGAFAYDVHDRLSGFYLSDDFENDFKEEYIITHSENLLTVDAIFKTFEEDDTLVKNVQYIYSYDHQLNPIKIQSYYWRNNEKILEKETDIQIIYFD